MSFGLSDFKMIINQAAHSVRLSMSLLVISIIHVHSEFAQPPMLCSIAAAKDVFFFRQAT